MLRNILLGVGIFSAILAVLIFSGKLPIGGNNASKPVGEVIIWGTLPQAAMDNIAQQFNPQANTYRITYKEVRPTAFIQTLLEALANGAGPDMIIAPHQIILSQAARLTAFPSASLSETAYKNMYVDGASIFYSPPGAIALPVSIDPMVLFYNRNLFSKHGIVNPPAFWDELPSLAPRLTVLDTKGKFIESAIAIGSPSASYAKDITMAIVEQLGQTPTLKQFNASGAPFISVLANTPTQAASAVLPLTTVARFLSQFADSTQLTYSWSDFAGNGDDQFVAEKLAMYIGYAGEYGTLKERNPKGDFAITTLPQTRGYNTFNTGATVYGIATLKTSKNPVTALTVEGQFAGAGISPTIAAVTGAVPALRSYSTTPGLDTVISRSMLVAHPWYDSFPTQSANLIATMFSDILNGRQGVADAASIFVNRLQDLYTPH
jgi:ABC-type glycerol-3-phosphate transport system substrate-binding protein